MATRAERGVEVGDWLWVKASADGETLDAWKLDGSLVQGLAIVVDGGRRPPLVASARRVPAWISGRARGPDDGIVVRFELGGRQPIRPEEAEERLADLATLRRTLNGNAHSELDLGRLAEACSAVKGIFGQVADRNRNWFTWVAALGRVSRDEAQRLRSSLGEVGSAARARREAALDQAVARLKADPSVGLLRRLEESLLKGGPEIAPPPAPLAGEEDGVLASPPSRPRMRSHPKELSKRAKAADADKEARRQADADEVRRQRTVEHERIVDLLAEALRDRGLPATESRHCDLMTKRGDQLIIFEVKTVTPLNVVSQVRLGIGALLQYRWMAADPGAKLVLVLSREPSSWVLNFLQSVGVEPLWLAGQHFRGPAAGHLL